MARKNGFDHGAPAWVDLATTDVEAAKKFYSDLFGWEWSGDAVPGGGTYWTAHLKGEAVAGLSGQQQAAAAAGAPSTWNTSISVGNADDTVARAKEAGGTVLAPPMDITETGRFAVLADPAGAPIGLWQARNMKGAGLTGEPGTMVWHDVYAADTDAEVAFYTRVFGWKTSLMDAGGGPPYTSFMLGEDRVAGTYPPQQPGTPAHWQVWFGSADVGATAARVTELGGEVLSGPIDTPIGSIAFLRDPTGAEFSVQHADDQG